MKAADFIYHRARSVDEALGLLEDYDGGARILAGGQSLVPMLNMRLLRPSALIDVNGIEELSGIEVRGDHVVLGAMVRHLTVETSPLIAKRLPLLARMIRSLGDRQVRNRGTIGGSLVQGDPTGEMPLGCLLLKASVRVIGPGGEREITMEHFYSGSYAASLEPNEILHSIIFPPHPQHFAFREVSRRHNDFATVSVAAVGNRSADGRWSDLRLGLGGVHETPILVPGADHLLAGSLLAEDEIRAAADAAVAQSSPSADMRASEDYRRHLVFVYVQRVLRDLRAAAQH